MNKVGAETNLSLFIVWDSRDGSVLPVAQNIVRLSSTAQTFRYKPTVPETEMLTPTPSWCPRRVVEGQQDVPCSAQYFDAVLLLSICIYETKAASTFRMHGLCLPPGEAQKPEFSQSPSSFKDATHPWKVVLQYGAQWKPIGYVCMRCFCWTSCPVCVKALA